MIADYPAFSEFTLSLRPMLHPLFQKLPDGVSEFTFAGLYLFRGAHRYRIARLPDGEGERFVVAGRDAVGAGEERPFFMLPFGLPRQDVLNELFDRFGLLRAIPDSQAPDLRRLGYEVREDRDSFDYLYSREEMANLAGRKFHKKKNLYNAFVREHRAEGKPLLEECRDEALRVLEAWRSERDDPGDYDAAREALERMWELQLCGGIYYVRGEPVGYSLGEEIARGKTFAIHFEKAARAGQYKGIFQFINRMFASILPAKYETINREQDLGDAGLRQAKESYNPVGFVRKHWATKA